MVAANVPPNTIIIGASKKRALTVPPSNKKAPKIETIPKINPKSVPAFFIINNLIGIWVKSSRKSGMLPAACNPGFAFPGLLWLHQRPVHQTANLL